jgi:hypothetical protein
MRANPPADLHRRVRRGAFREGAVVDGDGLLVVADAVEVFDAPRPGAGRTICDDVVEAIVIESSSGGRLSLGLTLRCRIEIDATRIR